MTKIETLCREFITLTAGRCNTHAHGKLALAVSRGNFTAAWPRVRNVADSIGSAKTAGYSREESHQLGGLLNEIEAEWKRLRRHD